MTQPSKEPIPGYRVEELLGRGQYGEVWRAKSPGGADVALKFLDMTGCHGWKEFRSVQRVKKIRHAHLMPIVAIWLLDADGQVMADDALDSLAAGSDDAADTVQVEEPGTGKLPAKMVIASLLGDMSLRDRLNECAAEGVEGVPVKELLGYMHEAAKGIDYLNSVRHEFGGDQVGVQHCDIKPDNILLTGGSVVIADFGVAQVFAGAGSDARATSLSGSPAYMAPEAFQAHPSATSDQYSLAITYYELRTGELPLDVDNFAAAYEAHRSGGLDFQYVTEDEQWVLRKATHLDPEERYSSSIAFIEDLQEALRDTPAQAPSRTKELVATIVLLLALLIATPFLIWGMGPKSKSVALRFDPPEVTVTVNGENYTPDASGLVELDALVNSPLSIAARAAEGAGRKPLESVIKPEEILTGDSFEFELPFTPEHLAAEADRLLARGLFLEAVRSYASAIREEPGRYQDLPEPEVVQSVGVLWPECMQVASDGALLVGGRDGVVRRWTGDASSFSGEPTTLNDPTEGSVVSLAVNDQMVAFADEEGAIWAARSGESAIKVFEEPGADIRLALTGDGEWLVAAVSIDLATKVYAWDATSRNLKSGQKLLGEQPGEFPHTAAARLDRVVLATQDNTAIVWSWRAGSKSHEDHGSQKNHILSLVVSADGETAAYAGEPGAMGGTSGPALVKLRTNNRFALTKQTSSITSCALDGSGEHLALAERMGPEEDEGTVQVLTPQVGSGDLRIDRLYQFDRELGDVKVLAYSPDGSWLAAGHEYGAVTLWQAALMNESPLLTHRVGRDQDRVESLCFSPDQRRLYSLGRDGVLMVFDLERLRMVAAARESEGVEDSAESSVEDRVTLRGRSFRPAARFPWGSARTVSHRVARPNAAHDG